MGLAVDFNDGHRDRGRAAERDRSAIRHDRGRGHPEDDVGHGCQRLEVFIPPRGDPRAHLRRIDRGDALVDKHLIPIVQAHTANVRGHGPPCHVVGQPPIDPSELGFGEHYRRQEATSGEKAVRSAESAIKINDVQSGPAVRRNIGVQIVRVVGGTIVVTIAAHAIEHPVTGPGANVGQGGHARDVEVIVRRA